MTKYNGKSNWTGIQRVIISDPADNTILAILDDIQNGTITGSADVVWATGQNGARLASSKNNKGLTFECTNGTIISGLLAQQLGDMNPEEDYDNASILKRHFDYYTAKDDNTVEVKYKAVGESGNEIGKIYAMNPDRGQGKMYEQTATATAETFAYDPTTNIIDLPTGVFKEGDEVIVYYNYLTKGRRLADRSDVFASDVTLFAEILEKGVCAGAKTTYLEFTMPRGTVDDGFSLALGKEIAVHNLKVEALQNLCSKDRELGYFVEPYED